MIGFDDSMPIGAMTIGDLKVLMQEIFETAAGQNVSKRGSAAPKRYVYGIKGIEELFGCSHATAQHYKDNVINEAVTQNGRKIIVDVEYAIELFGRRNGHGQK